MFFEYLCDCSSLPIKLHCEEYAWILSIFLVLKQEFIDALLPVDLDALIGQLAGGNDFFRHELNETQLGILVDDVERQQIYCEVYVIAVCDYVFQHVLAVLRVGRIAVVVVERYHSYFVIEQLDEVLQLLLVADQHVQSHIVANACDATHYLRVRLVIVKLLVAQQHFVHGGLRDILVTQIAQFYVSAIRQAVN